MATYIIRRILGMIPLIIAITLVTFLLMHFAPGNAILASINPRIKDKAELIARLQHENGWDKSWVIQYITWVGHFFTGQWGWSFSLNEPVSQAIREALPNTLRLAIVSEILILIVAIPLGIKQARNPYGKFDNFVSSMSLTLYAIPFYIIALLMIYFLAIQLNLFPPQNEEGSGPNAGSFLDMAYHVILPAIAISITSIASYSRYMRSSILEIRAKDFTRTAYAKGLHEKQVFRKHIFRNSMIPVVTLFGYDLGGLVGGAYIVEMIFAYHGMGYMTLQAAEMRDYNMIMATTVLTALAVLFGNLIADILYSIVDPRIRYS